MDLDTLALLCAPRTGEPLELVAGAGGSEVLRGVRSGDIFPLREGIPNFLQDADLAGPNARYQQLYNRIAALYDLPFRLMSAIRPGWEKRFRSVYLDRLEIGDGDRVLEVSVGTGANLSHLPRTARYFGLDLSWGMLRRCQRRVRSERIAAELFLGAAEALPFGSRLFDCVFHVGGINFFSDRAAALREMVRVARPGTKIVVVDETEETARRIYERVPGLRRYFRGRTEAITAPLAQVPPEARDVTVRELRDGELYCLEFRTPEPP